MTLGFSPLGILSKSVWSMLPTKAKFDEESFLVETSTLARCPAVR